MVLSMTVFRLVAQLIVVSALWNKTQRYWLFSFFGMIPLANSESRVSRMP
jgi:hypothetical protein